MQSVNSATDPELQNLGASGFSLRGGCSIISISFGNGGLHHVARTLELTASWGGADADGVGVPMLMSMAASIMSFGR